jgi:hypothetical protein
VNNDATQQSDRIQYRESLQDIKSTRAQVESRLSGKTHMRLDLAQLQLPGKLPASWPRQPASRSWITDEERGGGPVAGAGRGIQADRSATATQVRRTDPIATWCVVQLKPERSCGTTANHFSVLRAGTFIGFCTSRYATVKYSCRCN